MDTEAINRINARLVSDPRAGRRDGLHTNMHVLNNLLLSMIDLLFTMCEDVDGFVVKIKETVDAPPESQQGSVPCEDVRVEL